MLTRIQKNACKGWKDFRLCMMEIWEPYNKYGNIVLEKELESSDKTLQHLFEEAKGYKVEFENLIRKYWEDNYHKVAKSLQELIDMLKEVNSDSLSLLPETGTKYLQDEEKGSDKCFSISEEMYNRIKGWTTGKEKEVLLIDYDKRDIYKIHFSNYDTKQSYYELIISKCHTIISV